MRNLKKILALVLALVMSLSLMATASAAETTSASSADTYAVAKQVLEGLEVYKGDLETGSMAYERNVKRSEAAALLYRIATGDVKDTQAKLYSNKNFTDGVTGHWAEGYIGYCYNAEIVKGVNTEQTMYDPDGDVTGYQLLAMALRTLGYGKNHEFEGDNWIIQTAATAEREGLLKGVTPSDSVTLGQPATRGLIAQILFNTLLHNTVRFDVRFPNLYPEDTTTLGWQQFQLEKEVGAVVVANHWANLNGTAPLAENKVKVELTDGTTRTLNWSADDKATGGKYAEGLKDIGQSRDIYFTGSKVLSLADTGLNDIGDNDGAAVAKLSEISSASTNSDTEYYTNYVTTETTKSTIRIEISLELSPSAIGTDRLQFQVTRDDIETALGENQGTSTTLKYKKVIPYNTTVSPEQIAVMKEIYRIADNSDNTLGIQGSISVGTSSATDVSDSGSYEVDFAPKYLTTTPSTFSSAGNGEWLRVIDNDGDGIAEYVLKVVYDLDEIVQTSNSKYYYRDLNIEKYTVVELDDYTQAVGDYVVVAKINNRAYVHMADSTTAVFKTIDYINEIVYDNDGGSYENSEIRNHTAMPDELMDADEQTTYTLYLDDFGYVGAYSNTVNYALLTQMYGGGVGLQQSWVSNTGTVTVEAMPAGGSLKEYTVLNHSYNGYRLSNPFFGTKWTYPGITNSVTQTTTHGDNCLVPATHGLGTSWQSEGNGAFVYSNAKDPKYNSAAAAAAAAGTSNPYDATYTRNSWTNVAKYSEPEDGKLNLYTAAGKSANGIVTDYVQLATNVDVSKNNALFRIDDPDYGKNTGEATTAARRYVRALDSTLFYVVTLDQLGTARAVRQYTGYSNVKNLTAAATGNAIRSMYAVAHYNENSFNVDGNNYWSGDVIVIEMYADTDGFDSIALIYSDNSKTTGEVRKVEAIDRDKGLITIVPGDYNVWEGTFGGFNYAGLGFYGVNNLVEREDGAYTADLYYIGGTYNSATKEPFDTVRRSYNDNKIYYGQVRSLDDEDTYSNYITVDLLDVNGEVSSTTSSGTKNTATIGTKALRVPKGNVWGIQEDTWVNYAVSVFLSAPTVNNKVEVGDRIIWVETSTANTAGFMVDLTDVNKNGTYRAWADTASFLTGTDKIDNKIAKEQPSYTQPLVLNFLEGLDDDTVVYYPITGAGDIITSDIPHTPENGVVTLYVPASIGVNGKVTIKLSMKSTPQVGWGNGYWEITDVTGTKNPYTIELTKVAQQITSASLIDTAADEDAHVVIASYAGWRAFLAEVAAEWNKVLNGEAVNATTLANISAVLESANTPDYAESATFQADTLNALKSVAKELGYEEVKEALEDNAYTTIADVAEAIEEAAAEPDPVVTFSTTGTVVKVNDEEVTSQSVTKGDVITFTVALDETGNYSAPIVVKQGDTVLGAVSGEYTSLEITKDTTITVTATENTAATVVVQKAVHGTGIADEVNDKVEVAAPGTTVTITNKGMTEHAATGGDKESKVWVGFEICLNPAEGETAWSHVSYAADGGEMSAFTAVETGLRGKSGTGDGTGLAMYYDISGEDYATAGTYQLGTLTVQFGNAATPTVKSTTVTYRVQLVVPETATATEQIAE